jgi:hypothetical protein
VQLCQTILNGRILRQRWKPLFPVSEGQTTACKWDILCGVNTHIFTALDLIVREVHHI